MVPCLVGELNPGGSWRPAKTQDLTDAVLDSRRCGDAWSRYEFAARFCRGKRVLDFGCGFALPSLPVRRLSSEYLGLDIDGEAIQWDREHLVEPSQKCGFDIIDEGNSLAALGSFETVIAFEVLEHVRNAAETLDRLRKCVSPTGHIIVSTPNGRFSHHNPSLFTSPFHLYEFEPTEFVQMISQRGSHVQYFKQHRRDHLDSIGLAIRASLIRSGLDSTGFRPRNSDGDPRVAGSTVVPSFSRSLYYRFNGSRMWSISPSSVKSMNSLNYTDMIAVVTVVE